MKLLVFAHTPPPHHGQSYMVKLMLDGFGDGAEQGVNRFGIECYHVNARLSKDLEDIGSMRPQKFIMIFWHCLCAIYYRMRHGVTAFYYIPAPGKRSALWRDWMVMTVCRPFFKDLILHWHAAGMGKWLETDTQLRTRAFTYRAIGRAHVSIVLSNYNRADAEKLLPDKVKVVHNGIEDPCPDFEKSLLLRRRAQLLERLAALQTRNQRTGSIYEIRVAYLAHCTREKGVFDAANGVLKANKILAAQGVACRMVLSVAGTFLDEKDKAEFKQLLANHPEGDSVKCLGFVTGKDKYNLLHQTDLFCFPTFFPNENAPVNVIEAIAFGLPVVTTRWRSVPELLPKNHPGLVEIQSPEQVAEKLLHLAQLDCFAAGRQHFMDHYLLERHLENLSNAIKAVED